VFLFVLTLDFQFVDDPLSYARASPFDVPGSRVSSSASRCSQCAEYSSRISDLETRLTLAKRQAKMAVDKASKACGFMKQISALDDQVSSLTARVVHHEECESFILGIIESACEMLRCKTLFRLLPFLLNRLSQRFLRYVLPSQAPVWISQLRIVELLNEVRLLKECPRMLRLCGLILDVEMLSCYFKIAPSMLANQLMVVEEL
jgi:hypothetical protein